MLTSGLYMHTQPCALTLPCLGTYKNICGYHIKKKKKESQVH